MREYLMECIGTFFLLLVVALTGNPIAIGGVLMVMVYMGGHISGAHYNPAVTLAVWLRGKIKAAKALWFMVAQVIGAFFAAWAYWCFQGATFLPAPALSFGKAALVEGLFTFALASVVLTVATTKKLSGNYIYGLAIGGTLMIGAFAGGALSGGVYNPAVALGPMILAAMKGNAAFQHLALYLIGPLAGGAVAAVVYKYLNPKG